MKKRYGISLIALIITIVIIIILTTVVFFNISKNNLYDTSKVAKLVHQRDNLDSTSLLYVSRINSSLSEIYPNKDIFLGRIDNVLGIVTDYNIILKGMNLYVVDEKKLKDEYDISLPKVSNKEKATWYIDVATGNFYLIYDSANYYEKYYGDYDYETEELKNTSLSSFVMSKKGFLWGEGMVPSASGIKVELSHLDWTNTDIDITLSDIPDDVVLTEYLVPGTNEWKKYEDKIVVPQNGTVIIKVTNKFGNDDIKTIIIEKIDKLVPNSIKFSPDSAKDVKEISVEIDSIEDVEETEQYGKSGIKEIKYLWTTDNNVLDINSNVWGSANIIKNGDVVTKGGITETNYIQVLVEDIAGNKKVFVSGAYQIDNTPPDVNAIVATLSPNIWTNSNINVTLGNIPTDAIIKQYTLPGNNTWIDYTGTFSVAQNGIINIRVEDAAGNESTKTVLVDKIDKLVPTGLTLSPNSSGATKSVTVKVTAQDAVANAASGNSGIKSVKYQWKTTNSLLAITDASWNSAGSVANGGNVTRNAVTETSYLHVLVEDNAGNKKTFVSSSYQIDNTAPNANAITATMSPNNWTNGNITVTLGSIPADASIKQYTLPGSSTWNNYTGAFTVTQNGNINIRVQDSAGNEATKTIVVNKIDKLVPTSLNLSPNSSGATKSVTVKVTAQDAAANAASGNSGIKSVKYQWRTTNSLLAITDASWNSAGSVANGGNVTRNAVTETSYLHVLVEDNAGNKKTFVSSSYQIDNTAPNANAITATMSPNNWTNGNITVTLGNIPADASIKQYTLPGSSTWNNYTGAFTVTQNGNINIRVQDSAGNEATKTIVVNKIDKLAPSSIILSPNSSSGAATVTVKITAQDAAANTASGNSGISEIRYQWKNTNAALSANDSSWNSASTIANGGSISKSGTGTVYLHVRAKDNAGNYKVIVSSSYILHTHSDSCYVHKHTSSCYTTHYHSSCPGSCYTYGVVGGSSCGTCGGKGTVTVSQMCTSSDVYNWSSGGSSSSCSGCGKSCDYNHYRTRCNTCGGLLSGYRVTSCGCTLSDGDATGHKTITTSKTCTSCGGSGSVSKYDYYLTCGKSNGTSYLTCGRTENLSYNCGY